MADRFDAHADELGALMTKENGKILAQGMFESTTAGGTLRHNAAEALTDTGISAEVAPGQWFSTYAEPAGVVGIYTGSTTVGRLVAADGAPTLKRMNLELGGKTPMIVFDDADLDAAVPLVASAVTTFAGQFCTTGSRILVQRGVADRGP
jgi:acyl-CoA reductase-like NAD-dependent aldehyde dehydrogenase